MTSGLCKKTLLTASVSKQEGWKYCLLDLIVQSPHRRIEIIVHAIFEVCPIASFNNDLMESDQCRRSTSEARNRLIQIA